MKARLDLRQANAAEVLRVMAQFGPLVQQSGLDSKLVHLIEIRASQINGCGY